MDKCDVSNYDDSFGVLPTLELYEQRRARKNRIDGTEIPRTFNWTIHAVNGEPLARGSGEFRGGFKTWATCWKNARLTCFAFGGDRLPERLPRPGSDLAVFDEEDGNPVLRIRRL